MLSLISPSETSGANFGKALYAPIGMVSPLWFLFVGATSAGLAYWWMTRWSAMATNGEAMVQPLATPALELPVPAPAPTPPEVLAEAVAEVIPVATVLEEPAPLTVEPKPTKAPKVKTPPVDDPPLTH